MLGPRMPGACAHHTQNPEVVGPARDGEVATKPGPGSLDRELCPHACHQEGPSSWRPQVRVQEELGGEAIILAVT